MFITQVAIVAIVRGKMFRIQMTLGSMNISAHFTTERTKPRLVRIPTPELQRTYLVFRTTISEMSISWNYSLQLCPWQIYRCKLLDTIIIEQSWRLTQLKLGTNQMVSMMSGHVTVQGVFCFTILIAKITNISLCLHMFGLHMMATVGPRRRNFATKETQDLARTSLLQTFLTSFIQIFKWL